MGTATKDKIKASVQAGNGPKIDMDDIERPVQLGFFEGTEVEALEGKIKAGPIHLDEESTVPKLNEKRFFIVMGEVVKVGHEHDKKTFVLKRTCEFDVVTCQEINEIEFKRLKRD